MCPAGVVKMRRGQVAFYMSTTHNMADVYRAFLRFSHILQERQDADHASRPISRACSCLCLAPALPGWHFRAAKQGLCSRAGRCIPAVSKSVALQSCRLGSQNA